MLAIAMLLTIASCGGNEQGEPPTAVWGTRGLMPGQFVKPRAIAVGLDDSLYLVDMQAHLQRLSPAGDSRASWRTPTHQLGRPSGLAVDAAGHLLVADSHYHRILEYDPEGQLLRMVGGDDGDGPLVGFFGYIADVAVDRLGYWYVAENQQQERIVKLSPDGPRVITMWGGRGAEPGQFQRARALAFGPDDRLYVADACNHRVQVFDTDGILVRIIGSGGSGPGQLSYPFDVAIAPDGSLYVVEYGNHRVQKFSATGRSLGTWGRAGRRPGELFNPWAIAVDHQGRVYVVDSNNHRIQVVPL